jgi:hypothetical protein
MNRFLTIISAAAVLALPAAAGATKPETHAPKGNAYGKYCQGESKKHVKGEKGTAFSRCVAAAKDAAENGTPPNEACKTLSKKHVKGEKGTAYSRCVSAAAKAQNDAA